MPISTTTWSTVFELARNLGAKKMQFGGTNDVVICQFVAARMYTYRAWSWACINAPINSLPLVIGEQDYPAPSDMYRLTQAWITVTYPNNAGLPYDPAFPNNGGSPDQNYNLEVVKNLTPDKNMTGFYGGGCITFVDKYGVLRLGQAVQPPTPGPNFLNCTYQPKMEKVTDLSMPLPFPDEYADVAVKGVLYWLYKFADDDRAGTAVKQGNAVQYSGQLGEFETSLFTAAQDDQATEVDSFFPESPLGQTYGWGPYPYIWVN